jgi:2,3-bisphosphoglycerate-independent phosphoglycerate mutase
MCIKEKVNNVYIHIITDGRDTAPDSSIKYIKMLNEKIDGLDNIKIATLCGRYYMMDRDNRFERVKLAYDMLTIGSGDKYNRPEEAWKNNQAKGITDEFINPSLINRAGILSDNDSIITFNFRPDRLRELYASLTNKEFNCFERKMLNNLKVVTMMPVSDEVICANAFELENINNVLGTVISNNNLSQLRIAETEKYAHVTYFFDGGKELELNNCKKILIPSPKVSTYDLEPEMSAYTITDTLLDEIKNNKYDLVVLNYANGDMVGHTGVYEKGIIAVETVDKCIEKIINNIDLSEYTIIITADHGNCEEMINEDDTVNTAHTTNLVPFIILDKNIKLKENYIGSLSDIAPTILKIMNLDIPKEMTGDVLINGKN